MCVVPLGCEVKRLAAACSSFCCLAEVAGVEIYHDSLDDEEFLGGSTRGGALAVFQTTHWKKHLVLPK